MWIWEGKYLNISFYYVNTMWQTATFYDYFNFFRE